MVKELVIEHLPIALRLARKRVRRQRADVEDAEGAAVIGLIEAAQTFRPEDGVPFAAFAHWRIRGAIAEWQRSNHVIPMRRDAEAAAFTVSLDDLVTEPAGPDSPEQSAIAADLMQVLRSRLGTRKRGAGRPSPNRRLAVLSGMLLGIDGMEMGRGQGVTNSEISRLRAQVRRAFAEVVAC